MQVAEEKENIVLEIKKTLQYFHIFKHPLPIEEIRRYLSVPISLDLLKTILLELLNNGEIYKHKDLYMLVDNLGFADKRINGAAVAQKRYPKAMRSAKIIAQFPFVSGICISGSLSKNYADEKSDIDFFIITKAKRLWICRTALHVFKKFTFLVNKQHSFCMNYFLDESLLELEEKNRFTATELITLIPVYNKEIYNLLQEKNKEWVAQKMPNAIWKDVDKVPSNTSFIKSMSEFVLNMLWPTKLNDLLMKLTDKKWRRKWSRKNYPMEEYDIAMKTKWYVSKNHPANYQKKVLNKVHASIAN